MGLLPDRCLEKIVGVTFEKENSSEASEGGDSGSNIVTAIYGTRLLKKNTRQLILQNLL